jgi:hypothetical protein
MKRAALALIAAAACAVPASADVFQYQAFMDGPSESPPNASPGTGFALVTWDNVAHTMRIQANFTGLLGTTTAAHIHAPTAVPGVSTAGVATQTPSFAGFPLGVTSGVMDQMFDLTLNSSWNAPFITANGGTPASAEAAFFGYINEGRAYFNIHSSSFGGGEIRGFLALVPAPGTAFLGLGMLMTARRRR